MRLIENRIVGGAYVQRFVDANLSELEPLREEARRFVIGLDASEEIRLRNASVLKESCVSIPIDVNLELKVEKYRANGFICTVFYDPRNNEAVIEKEVKHLD